MGRLDGVTLHLVDSWDEAQNFMSWLSEDRGRNWLAVDTETTGLEWFRDRLRMIQIGDTRDGWAMPADMWGGLADEAFRCVRGVRWVAHNAPFDGLFLTKNGYAVPPLDDTLPMLYLLEPDKPKGLKPGSARRIDPRARRGEQELRSAMQKAKWNWATIPWNFPYYWKYAALDPVLTACLAENCWPHIEAEYKYAYELQLQSNAVLVEMQYRGIRVDLDYVTSQKRALDEEFNELVSWFDREYGVDPMSPQQLVKMFWEQGIELPLTTAKGEPSVRKEALEMIDHPLVAKILRARKCQKMSSAFFGNMIDYADGDMLHPSINPLGAITGRMSITRPALQTLPRTALIRDAFIPRKGNKLVLADWQGQELRVFAAFCQDPEMLAAFERGEDLHNFTARTIFGDNFTKQHRRTAKGGGFAKIYGAGVEKFSKTMGITSMEGRDFLDSYDALFPLAKAFQGRVAHTVIERAGASAYGWITTLAGRKIPVPREQAYKGVNYIVQGSCSDILRLAMVNIDNAGMGEYLVLPVHDELAADVPIELADDVVVDLTRVMEGSKFDLNVPMVVEPAVVDRWGDKYD